mgnify:CR=1 FL=1
MFVKGDVKYFPKLKETGGEMLLSEWLKTAAPDTVAYFSSCIELFGLLVEGRNKHTTKLIKDMLPYDLIYAIATDAELVEEDTLCRVAAMFVGLIRYVYIDNEPNELMAYVKTVRIWKNVPSAAKSRDMSTRLTMKMDHVDWEQFNRLETFIVNYVGDYTKQESSSSSIVSEQ